MAGESPRIRRGLALGCALLLLGTPAPASAQGPARTLAANFVANDPVLVGAAEQARVQSALFWTEQELPGRWSAPCRIEWAANGAATRSGWGRSQFLFGGGEVFGWRITVAGPRNDVLQDVIPHEVDHLVRASLVRRPIPRWLDEGCAAVHESPEAHERLRAMLAAGSAPRLTAEFLEACGYPRELGEQQQLYAAGFSLVELLLDVRGPAGVLDVQRHPDGVVAGLEAVYGLTPADLDRQWRTWRRSRGAGCMAAECIVHRPPMETSRAAQAGLPGGPMDGCRAPEGLANRLTIFTAEWCGPCREFWSDWNADAGFRAQVESRFHLHLAPVVGVRHGAQGAPLRGLPTFRTLDGDVVGYEGKDWLLSKLGIPSAPRDGRDSPAAGSPATPPPASSPEPSSTPAPGISRPSEAPLNPALSAATERKPAGAPESAGGLAAGLGRGAGLGRNPAPGPMSTLKADAASAPGAARSGLTPANHAESTGRQNFDDREKDADRAGSGGVERARSAAANAARFVLTALELAGLLGGAAATGGLGAAAVSIGIGVVRRRLARKRSPATTPEAAEEEVRTGSVRAPFPRRLDEARELLALRKSERRVAVLDALRGMFLDDALEALSERGDPQQQAWGRELRAAIDARVDEAAPLTTDV